MPAVFVHGVPDTHHVWDDLVTHLSRPDLVLLDLPGFLSPAPTDFSPAKESYVAWLIAEIEAMGEPVDLVGHDWGAILAVRVATVRPELLRTLAHGSGPVDECYVWHDAAQMFQTPDVGEQVIDLMTPETMGPAMEGAGLAPVQASRTAEHINDHMKASILSLYRSAVDVGAEWGPSLSFPGPSLALWGGADDYAGPEVGAWMAERLGSRLVVFDDCHHWWPLARPKESAAELEMLWSS